MKNPNPPELIVYGITNCDTVKKARAWLDAQGQSYRFHDFKKQGLPQDALDRWLPVLGWERLVNRKGTTWRRLDPAVQADLVSETAARALMENQISVIKRPVVEWPDAQLSVGFDASEWASRLAKTRC